MYQGCNRFFTQTSANTWNSSCSQYVLGPNTANAFGIENGTQIQRYVQNKVLAIMEHWIFQKQAYLCTGSEKITKRFSIGNSATSPTR